MSLIVKSIIFTLDFFDKNTGLAHSSFVCLISSAFFVKVESVFFLSHFNGTPFVADFLSVFVSVILAFDFFQFGFFLGCCLYRNRLCGCCNHRCCNEKHEQQNRKYFFELFHVSSPYLILKFYFVLHCICRTGTCSK